MTPFEVSVTTRLLGRSPEGKRPFSKFENTRRARGRDFQCTLPGGPRESWRFDVQAGGRASRSAPPGQHRCPRAVARRWPLRRLVLHACSAGRPQGLGAAGTAARRGRRRRPHQAAAGRPDARRVPGRHQGQRGLRQHLRADDRGGGEALPVFLRAAADGPRRRRHRGRARHRARARDAAARSRSLARARHRHRLPRRSAGRRRRREPDRAAARQRHRRADPAAAGRPDARRVPGRHQGQRRLRQELRPAHRGGGEVVPAGQRPADDGRGRRRHRQRARRAAAASRSRRRRRRARLPRSAGPADQRAADAARRLGAADVRPRHRHRHQGRHALRARPERRRPRSAAEARRRHQRRAGEPVVPQPVGPDAVQQRAGRSVRLRRLRAHLGGDDALGAGPDRRTRRRPTPRRPSTTCATRRSATTRPNRRAPTTASSSARSPPTAPTPAW